MLLKTWYGYLVESLSWAQRLLILWMIGRLVQDLESDERPLHRVKLDGFWMSKTPVTNQEFKNFVDSTGYITTAEKPINLNDIMKDLPPGTPAPSRRVSSTILNGFFIS